MVNFYKEGGIGKIQFASGQIVSLTGNVSVTVEHSTGQIIIGENGRDLFWISTSGTLQVNGSTITGTNDQKGASISAVFQTATGGGEATDFSTLQSFVSNDLAVADLGAGKLYKSTTLINGSPIILITV